MEEHPIKGLMEATMDNLKDIVKVNTIIGDPFEAADGTVIFPVSKLGFGFATGGSEYSMTHNSEGGANEYPFGGGSGGGVSITPVAFLIVNKSETKLIHLNENTQLYEKIIDIAPQTVSKLKDILQTSTGSNDEKEQKSEQPMNYEI